MATIALYGPDNARATKVAVGIVRREGGDVGEMGKWLSEIADVREVATIGGQILAFLRAHGARTVVLGPGILGCPHEEGIDSSEGAY